MISVVGNTFWKGTIERRELILSIGPRKGLDLKRNSNLWYFIAKGTLPLLKRPAAVDDVNFQR